MVGYGAGAYQLTMLDRVQLYEHADCGEKDLGEYPDAGPVLPGDGGMGGNGNNLGDRTGIACACNGGPGSGSTGVLLALVGIVVLRKRRRA
jgi:MYXO-CTERM domain-containing protein